MGGAFGRPRFCLSEKIGKSGPDVKRCRKTTYSRRIRKLLHRRTCLAKLSKIALMAALLLAGTGLAGPGMVRVVSADDTIIDFPDPNLKKALIANGVDTNGDGQISIAEMESATGHLDLRKSYIRDLTGLEHAIRVQSIDLSLNPVEDLAPLSHLKGLYYLTLSNTNVSDLRPLAGLKLIELDLFNTKIVDIGPLSTLDQLTVLTISFTNVSDLSPLANKKLNILFATATNVRDISVLSTFSTLYELHLIGNQLEDISPLSRHEGLRILKLDYNNIRDIRPLSGLKNLRDLYLSNNRISDLSPLAGLKSLEELFVDDNEIRDISALAGLTRLAHLGISHNDIERIDALAGLRDLIELYLGYNGKITDFTPISNLVNMRYLSMDGLGLEDIGMLEPLTRMVELNLSDNRLRNLDALRNMSELRELRASNNQLVDISALSDKNLLYHLELYDNPNVDAYPVKDLPNLKYLKLDNSASDLLRSKIPDVVEGGVYSTDVVLNFGPDVEVTLNGRPIESGHTVTREGRYEIVIFDGVLKYNYFIIDKTPPNITGVVDGGVYVEPVTIRFDEGRAELNGKPASVRFEVDQITGEPNYELYVGEYGDHELIVTDEGGNRAVIRFTIKAPDVVVRGVTDLGLYTTERTIRFSDGTATLNGKPIRSWDKVSEPGQYELVVTGPGGNRKTIRFTIIEPGSPDPGAPAGGATQEAVALKGVSGWAQREIADAQSLGLTDPVARLDFAKNITREQFALVALRLYELLTGTDAGALDAAPNPFRDVQNPDIVRAYRLGIVRGTAQDLFSPDAQITREQLATMLKRVLDEGSVRIPYGKAKAFDDRSRFSDFAAEAIEFMSSIDVVKGTSERTFGPKENTTVEQAVIMAKRLHETAVSAGAAKPAAGSGSGAGQGMGASHFRDGGMFRMYIAKVEQYPGRDQPTNRYALTNDRPFILPAYSAIYLTAPNNQTPGPDFNTGTLVIANTSGNARTVSSSEVNMPLDQLYSDNWGTITHPDGTTEIMRSSGPYFRLVVFDGPFDSGKPYGDYMADDRVLDAGDWFAVRHDKTPPNGR